MSGIVSCCLREDLEWWKADHSRYDDRDKEMANKTHTGRDTRLLAAIALLTVSFIAGSIQAWILSLYLDAVISHEWSYFSEMFSL
jgi:hypothetical protein